MTNDGIGD